MNELLDVINIKTFPETIIDYLKSKNIDTKVKNLRSFYSILLLSINEDVKDSYLNRILKYLPAKEESEILILSDISEGIYKKELIDFFSNIHQDIRKSTNYVLFYKKLTELCKVIYFEKDEADQIRKAFDDEEYVDVLYLLFIHACKNYKTNTPDILALRLLKDSFSILDWKDARYTLLKMSADLGNETACQLYANYITDYHKQASYFLKGKASPQNLWELAYVIEHYNINNEIYNEVKKELKDIIIKGESFLEVPITVMCTTDTFEMDCILLSLNIYLYLANVKKLSKAYNSVGKFFLFNKVNVVDKTGNIDKKKNEELGLDFLWKAIRLSNINAIQNLTTYYYENKIKTDFDLKELLKIGANAKDIASSVYLFRILLDENKPTEAEEYLKFIANTNDDANIEAQYKLAKIYENKLQLDDAIKYYEKAINNDYYLASYDLAKLYFNKAMTEMLSDNKKKGYLLMSINLLESYFEQYDIKIKKEAKTLLSNMKKLIEDKQ